MQTIKAVFFDPVGCLAEFRPDEFACAAAELFGTGPADSQVTGSQAYWQLLGLMRQHPLSTEGLARLMEFERQAVDRSELYEDVCAALEAITLLDVSPYLASSLSRPALVRFIERHALGGLFVQVNAREEPAAGMAQVWNLAIAQAGLEPAGTMALVDTAEGIDTAKALGLNAMLMINDYDEGRALADRNPSGAIVSLAELPAALRLIEQRSGRRAPPRPPRAPFELFDPT